MFKEVTFVDLFVMFAVISAYEYFVTGQVSLVVSACLGWTIGSVAFNFMLPRKG